MRLVEIDKALRGSTPPYYEVNVDYSIVQTMPKLSDMREIKEVGDAAR